MKRFSVICMGLLAVALTVAGCAGHRLPNSGWVTLIDGSTGLENFNRVGDANWRAEGGAIVADKGKGGHLVSKKSYKDFEIYAEFWAETTTNSGIFIRSTDANKIGTANAYEVNIFDQRPDPSYGTGAIVGIASVNPMPKAAGKWNTFEITARGDEMTVVLNGVVTAYARHSQFPAGVFSLQYGGGANNTPGGAIKWRKVMIREL